MNTPIPHFTLIVPLIISPTSNPAKPSDSVIYSFALREPKQFTSHFHVSGLAICLLILLLAGILGTRTSGAAKRQRRMRERLVGADTKRNKRERRSTKIKKRIIDHWRLYLQRSLQVDGGCDLERGTEMQCFAPPEEFELSIIEENSGDEDGEGPVRTPNLDSGNGLQLPLEQSLVVPSKPTP